MEMEMVKGMEIAMEAITEWRADTSSAVILQSMGSHPVGPAASLFIRNLLHSSPSFLALCSGESFTFDIVLLFCMLCSLYD